jgi:hypothetical protein
MDAERLLDRQARAQLPISRQLLLYLDPFALFKDASRGAAQQRHQALSWNCRMKWMLVPYIRRWLLIAGVLFLGIAPTEALAARETLFLVPVAAFAAGCCIAITVAVCAGAAWLLLHSLGDV